MKKTLLLAVALVLTAVSPASADHAVGTLSSPVGEPLDGAPVIEEGNWDFIANFPAGPGAEKPIGVDVEMFKRKIDGKVHKYAITSSMTIGFTIFDVTNPETPVRITDYGTAACGPEAQVQQIIDFLANGQDFQDSPLGTVHGWEDDVQITPNGKIAVIATDAPGRCHDPTFGGLEFVDVSDPANPTLLGLVRLNADSHNSTIDLDRPWLVYNSNSDTGGNNFIDIADFKSCLKLDPSKCKPVVSRFQMKDSWTAGSQTPVPSACHDITFKRHKLYGACINTTLIFNPKHVLKNGKLTGSHLTSKADVGQANACPLVAPSAEAMVDLSVVDCSAWTSDKWKEENLNSAHIRLVSLMRHPGVSLDEDSPGRKGIQISHKSDPVAGGRLVAINDERGGGLNAPPGPQPAHCGGGGIWFYDVRNAAHPKPAVMKNGKKAVFFPGPSRITRTEGSNCTSHVFWQWSGVGNFISAAWYSSGTQVFRYKTDFSTHPATVRFVKRKTYVPPGASTWTSRVFAQKKKAGKRVLYFVATDIARGFDFFKLTLPKP